MVPRVARGLVLGDVDRDGDLDVLVFVRESCPVLFRNDRSPQNTNHYLRVNLRGKGKNTKASGAGSG